MRDNLQNIFSHSHGSNLQHKFNIDIFDFDMFFFIHPHLIT